MKKILIYSGLLLSLVMGSCKKQIDENYNNPEQSTTPSIPGFFTSMLNNNRVRPSYWEIRTFKVLQPAIYSQVTSFYNSPTAYQAVDSYIGNYWSDFYYPSGNGSGVLALYKTIAKTYNSLSDADKQNQQVFAQAAKVVLYDQASQMIDLWGDIPFTEAGNLETNSSIKDPKFDDAKTLYQTFIAELKEVAAYFGSASLPSNVASSFSKQDILLKGSLDKWRRYTNALRLRLLMRLSYLDEASVKTQVAEMLSSSSNFPLMDGGNVGNYSPAATDALLQPLTNYNDNLNSALTEVNSFYAPDYLLNTVMLPANDPRIPVMFDKYGRTVSGTFVPNATYRAMPITYTTNDQDTAFASYSILDSATFLQNKNLPGVVMNAAEVNFLKAEAFERWGGGDAKAAYETAVTQSVYFYYYLNGLGTGTARTPTGITELLAAANVAYTGTSNEKLAKIWTQKWVNFGLLQATQAWSEYRRTKYPQLNFPATGKQAGFETPPNRLIYPNNETGYNTQYNTVRAKDKRDVKIFWDVK